MKTGLKTTKGNMRLVIVLLAVLASVGGPARGAAASGSGAQSASTDRSITSSDDFTVVRTVTVNFGKDKFEISRSQREQLRQLIAQAQGLQAYMISVAAYAPPPGAESLKLSMQRASAITAILRQAGVPLANVILTAGMDGPNHATPDAAAKGQAGDRSVVVTLLQAS
jgi:outer membrane protein OmpA-like peptidoglycan-associated protein